MILRGLNIFCALAQHELNDNLSAFKCEVTPLWLWQSHFRQMAILIRFKYGFVCS